jgi:tetratricopeptide (TPR) repeat protein
MTRLSVSQALEQARTHYAAGRIREAEAICRAVLRAAPEEHRAYRLLALAEFGGGDPAAARELLERAISLAPGRADGAAAGAGAGAHAGIAQQPGQCPERPASLSRE